MSDDHGHVFVHVSDDHGHFCVLESDDHGHFCVRENFRESGSINEQNLYSFFLLLLKLVSSEFSTISFREPFYNSEYFSNSGYLELSKRHLKVNDSHQ